MSSCMLWIISTCSKINSSNLVGILAGMRPCGVIVLLGELFVSESKNQVYGYLHSFFAMHPDVAKSIGKHVIMINLGYRVTNHKDELLSLRIRLL